MKLTGFALSVGLGMAAGAVAAMMLPKDCPVRQAAQKAADTVQDAASDMLDQMMQ